ncbi:calponin homology domain-containing protein DDB_G0272472-like [Mugil cephalus]|uniref:calponin homology domain-containing protein DDB_G0272472-like n=1 Tax=Mugil cephalus TaxID=48193 RepID=UPI001FB77041|nr:calponin homology domain-containing protein DDB_G0272472-like [Mugil cephalus]
MDELYLTFHFSSLMVLVFHVFLTHVCEGQSELIGSSQPIVSTLGEDVVLPCYLQPAVDVTDLTLEWARPDLEPRFVHVWRSQQELVGQNHDLFTGRTSLFIDELTKGNISLKLSKVKLADEGKYKCFIPSLEKETFVQLHVASAPVSSPVISLSGMDRDRGGVVLQICHPDSDQRYVLPGELVWEDLKAWRMFHVISRSTVNSGAFSVLYFYSSLFLIPSCGGHVIGPSHPLTALIGEDIILPCHLEPAADVSRETVEWSRPDLETRLVYVWRGSDYVEAIDHPSYKGRTSLFLVEMKHGNISLRLSTVKISDGGTYKCFVPKLVSSSTVQLVVGSVSSPLITIVNITRGGVVLQRNTCHVLLVHSFICVTLFLFPCFILTGIKPEDFSTHSSSSSSAITIGVIIVALMVIVAVSVFLWKWRQKKLKNKKDLNDEETQREKEKKNDPSTESLMGGRRERETLEDEDMETRPGLNPQMDDKTQQIQTNHDLVQIQGEREEGAGITERNSLDTKTQPETEPGREKTEDKTEEKPETRQNQQTEEGENMMTQHREDEMDEGKHGGETLNDEEQGKMKKKIKIPFKKTEIKKKKKKETQPEETKVQNVEDERKHGGEGLPAKMDDKTQQIQTNHDLVQIQGERQEGAGITERNSLDTKTQPETEPGREKTEDKTEEKTEMRQNQQTEEGENMMTQHREDEMDEGKHGGEPLNDEEKEKRKKKTKIQIKKKKETQPEEAEVQNVEDEGKHEREPKDKETEKLKIKLQMKEREEKKCEERVSRVKNQTKEKQKQINELIQQKREIEEIEKERLREEDGTEKTPLETKKDLEKKKSELDKDLEKKQIEMYRMRKKESLLIERINKTTKEKEEIVRKLEEMEKEKNEGENQRDSDEDL